MSCVLHLLNIAEDSSSKKWITYKLPSSLTCHVQNLSSSLTAQALGSLYVLLMLSYIIPRGLHLISKQGFGHWSHLHVKSTYVSCLVSCQFSCLKINLWNDVTKLWLHWCFSFWIEFESTFPFLFFQKSYSSCSEVIKRLFICFLQWPTLCYLLSKSFVCSSFFW